MMRFHHLAAAVLAAGAGVPLAAQAQPVIQLDQQALTYDVSAAYPAGIGPNSGAVGAGGPALEVDLTYNVAVEVRLIGAVADRLELRSASGGLTSVELRCWWADLDLPVTQQSWVPFPCMASGSAGPPAPQGGAVKRVRFRTLGVTVGSEQAAAAAGLYSRTVYFRVDAR